MDGTRTRALFAVVAALALATLSPGLIAGLPEGATIESLEVFPERVELTSVHAYRQILVTAKVAGGEQYDVTRLVKTEIGADVAHVSATGVVRADADGETTLEIRLGDASASIPVKVAGLSIRRPVSMFQDVQPVLSRLGCNAGTCHGSQAGKNGFKLSLRGYDSEFDHRALIDDLGGRRFNRAAPERSLFLSKLSGSVPHVGGVLAKPGEPYYEILRAWVAEGVRYDPESPRVATIEVFPRKPVLPLPGDEQQMAVLATFTDGTVRDVTHEAFVETSNTEVTKVSRDGIVTALRRGEAAIMARYEGRYSATPIFITGDRSGFEWTETPEYNYVDTYIYRKLREVKTLPSGLATDAEFLRRVYLDLTGLPPSARTARAFLSDRRDGRVKREELVDRLIGSAEFIEHWTNKWSDLLQVNRKWLGERGAEKLRQWIEGAVASNMPYDDFVHAVLDSSGSTLANPPASYYKVLRTAEDAMENTTQLFLGVRFSCNKCHDHPFERWTQSNYWELASYFAQIERKAAPGSSKLPNAGFSDTGFEEELISDTTKGEVSFPSGAVASPSFPYTHPGMTEKEGAARREELASWLTSSENPYFAKSYVNRVWSYFFGIGIIEPVDDIRAGNPPSHPELLDRLTREFIERDFDVRWLMRLITTSRTYQHSVAANRWNADDTLNYSHAIARRLTAEQLFDAVHLATGSIARFPGQPLGTRAVELLDANVKTEDGFLDLFGRPPRESACECERTGGMSLGQALSLVNGPTFAGAIHDPASRLTSVVELEGDHRAVVEELFLSFLSRYPSDEELGALAPTLEPRDPRNAESLSPSDHEELTGRFGRWLSEQHVARWTPTRPGILSSAGGATMTALEDGSILVSGESPDTDVYTVVLETELESITGLRLTLLPDESLPAKGPGRSDNGNLVLTEIEFGVVPLGDLTKGTSAALHNATQSHTQKDFAASQAVDGKKDDKKGWAIAPEFGKSHLAVFELKEAASVAGRKLVVVRIEQQYGSKHTLGRFRIDLTDSPAPVRLDTLPGNLVEILLKPESERSEDERLALLRQYLEGDGEIRNRIRKSAAQDIAWALANSPAFLFNR